MNILNTSGAQAQRTRTARIEGITVAAVVALGLLLFGTTWWPPAPSTSCTAARTC
ncbi:MAG TPA: hypothetical protein PLE12_03055 [Propionicimonas sp.]|jgi:hypothetical protein|nr:hypothetical protein [Propionicimonas sp.]